MIRVIHVLKTHLFVLVVLSGLLGVFYSDFLWGQNFLWDDLLFMEHPAFNYLATALASGRFPLWLPGLRCGMPFFCEPWVYYPPLWGLSLWVNDGKLASISIQWYIVGHLLLGGLFSYIFLKASRLNVWACIAGVVTFVFSGFMSLHLIHGGMGHAFMLLPLELFIVKRIMENRNPGRNSIYLILSIWMSFLAGFPQSVLYNAYFLAAYWLFLVWQVQKTIPNQSCWRWICIGIWECAKIALVFLMVGLLSMFVVLPTLQSWSLSARQMFGFPQISDLSLPWYYLIHGLIPNFFGATNGDGLGIPFWGFNQDTIEFRTWHTGYFMYFDFGFYAGQLALIAMAVLCFNWRKLWSERRDLAFFLGILPVVLWLMLGRYGGLFNIFYHVVPGFSMFRSPARIGCLFDFCAAVLAALLVDALWRGRPTLRMKLPLITISIVYVFLFFGVLMYGPSLFSELGDARLMRHALEQTGISIALFAVIAGLLVWIKRWGEGARGGEHREKGAKDGATGKKPGRMGGVKRVEGGAHSTTFSQKGAWGETSGPHELAPKWWRMIPLCALVALAFLDLYLAFHKFHQGRIKPEDYFADRNGLIAQMTKLREQHGPFRFAQLRDGKISEEIVFPRNIGYLYPGYEAPEGYILFNLKDYNLFGSITNERVRLDIMNVGVIANADRMSGKVSVMRYTNSLPRARFYHKVRAYADAKALCADLEAGRLDYQQTLGVLRDDCVQFGVVTGVPPVNAQASVRFIPKNSDEYQIQYQTTAPGVIFISESFYPGWEADDGKYPVIHAFGAFKGIVVPQAGSGVITVKFSPSVLWLGLAVSGTTLLGLVIAWVWFGREREGCNVRR